MTMQDRPTKPLSGVVEAAKAEAIDQESFTHHELSRTLAEEIHSKPGRLLTRKLDLFILPVLVCIYTLTFLDRVNIGNARLWSLEDDLGMTGNQFNIVTLIFYVPYILLEVPSNYVITRVKPRYWIAGLTMGFGLTVTLAGFAKSFGGFLVARLFIGIFEAGMYPGMLFLIGSWYTRRQVGARMAWFMVANDIAGSISGLLGAGLGSLDGTRGYSGWSWIFFIEGSITCLASIFAFLFIPSFPQESTFLKPEEKDLLLRRLAMDDQQYEGEEKMTWKTALNSLANWRLLFTGLMFLCVCNTSYSITVFQPTILDTFGWSSLKSNLLSSPVRIASGIVSVSVATLSNKLNRRGAFIILGLSISILGLFFTMLSHDYRLRYAGLYLGAIGIYIAQPLVLAWGVGQVVGKTRTGTMTAFSSSLGQTGGIISALIFPSSDGPYYVPGISVCIGLCGLGIGLAGFMWVFNAMQNNKRISGGESLRELGQDEQNRLGEKHPDFRFPI